MGPWSENSPTTKLIVLGGAIGIGGGIALASLPRWTRALEMTMYTAMVAVPILFRLRARRWQPRFRTTVLILCIVHGLFLWLLRSIFPYKTVLILIPYALLEVLVLTFLTIHFFGPAPHRSGWGNSKSRSWPDDFR